MLEDAEIFVNVVEQHSFSKAARKLKLTASIITRRIAKLENELKVRLLQRNTRQLALTEAGNVFYESCVNLLNIYSGSLKQVKTLNDMPIGTLKIGLPSSISYIYVSNALTQFCKKYPHLKIDIITGNHLIDLLSSSFDLIIHCGNLTDSNLYSHKIGQWRKITCATPGYLRQQGTPKKPEDLSQHNCLDHYDNRDGAWEYQINKSVKPIKVNGNVRVSSSMDLKELAVNGLGIVYLPSFTVKNELKTGKLKRILSDYELEPFNMYAVYPCKRYLSKKAQFFIDFLKGLELTV